MFLPIKEASESAAADGGDLTRKCSTVHFECVLNRLQSAAGVTVQLAL